MSTLHLVDPALRATLETFPPFELQAEILPPLRDGLNQMIAAADAAMPDDGKVSVEERTAPGLRGPDVKVLVFRPTGQTGALPAILDMHGGGYVIGSAAMTKASSKLFASEVGAVVVAVDYRLAPETTYPGPIEDCYAALKWLHDNASELQLDPKRIAVSGLSAGAGLAAALALLARDRGEVPVAFQHLCGPMLDDRTAVAADPHPYTAEFVWNPKANVFGWTALLGHEPGGPDVSPYAAAARATNLKGLPPAFIAVGALDLFLDEDVDYALRLTRAGVGCELHVYPGTYHGFQAAFGSWVVAEANRNSIDALKRALHPSA